VGLLLICAVAGWARDIPVYREYTRPVQFYDDRGRDVTAEEGIGPDQAALQAMRDSKAREAYLGKETLLDMSFESGKSVFARKRRPTAAIPSHGSGSGEKTRRRNPDVSEKNWLAQSLTLPSLGLASSNAAGSARSEESPGSRWGWLADGVSGDPTAGRSLSEEGLQKEWNPSGLPDQGLSGQPNPYASETASSSDFGESDTMRSAGAFRDEPRAGAESSGTASDRKAASFREWGGGARADSFPRTDYGAPSGIAELSQTRELISEWAVGARQDFSAVATVGARGNGASLGGGSASGVSSHAMDVRTPNRWGGAPSFGLSSGSRISSGRSSSWKGGWQANPVGASRPSQFQSLSDPVPNPVVPVSSPGLPPPSTSSGGYKPAWF